MQWKLLSRSSSACTSRGSSTYCVEHCRAHMVLRYIQHAAGQFAKIISWPGANLADSFTETIVEVAIAPPKHAVSHHVQVNDANTNTVVGIVSYFETYMLTHVCGALQAIAPI
jgi:hypothetical protein